MIRSFSDPLKPRSRERVTPTIQGSGDIRRYQHVREEYSLNQFCCLLKCSNSWGHSSSFGFRSHPTGLPTPEAITTTLSFLGLTAGLHHRVDQTHQSLPTYAGTGRIFLISGSWTHAECKLHIFGLELKAVIFGLPSLGYSISGHQVMVTTVSTYRARPIPTPCYV